MPRWCKIHSTFAPPDHPLSVLQQISENYSQTCIMPGCIVTNISEVNSIRVFNWRFKLYHSLSWFSRQRIGDIFLIFPSLIQIISIGWRQFAWNVKSCFMGKNKKNILTCRLLKILPIVQALIEDLSLILILNKLECQQNSNVEILAEYTW